MAGVRITELRASQTESITVGISGAIFRGVGIARGRQRKRAQGSAVSCDPIDPASNIHRVVLPSVGRCNSAIRSLKGVKLTLRGHRKSVAPDPSQRPQEPFVVMHNGNLGGISATCEGYMRRRNIISLIAGTTAWPPAI
jgi:hypothetical protein